MYFHGERKMSKCSCSSLALRDVHFLRMYGTRNSLAPFPHLLLWPRESFSLSRDLCVVSRCITQSSSRFLHLEISTEGTQSFCRKYKMPGYKQRPKTSALWWAPKEGILDSRVSFLVSRSLAYALGLNLPGQGWLIQDGTLAKPDQSVFSKEF